MGDPTAEALDDAKIARRMADLRERVERWKHSPGDGSGFRVTVPLPELRAVLAYADRRVAAERERCARVAETSYPAALMPKQIAAAIRQLGAGGGEE